MLFLDILEVIFSTIGAATVGCWVANLYCDRRERMDADATRRDAQLSPEGFEFAWSQMHPNGSWHPDDGVGGTWNSDHTTHTPTLSGRMDTLGAFMDEEFDGIEDNP